MKTLILLIMLSSISQASVVSVNVRNEDQKLVVLKKEMTTLVGSHLAENEHFRVLDRTNDDSLDLLSPELSAEDHLRAGTILHHMAIARNYFVSVLHSEYVAQLPRVNVRLNMMQPFNEFYHFVKDSKVEQFNNAVSVPPSSIKKMPGVADWGHEIWFRPAKAQEIDNAVYQSSKQLDDLNMTTAVIGSLTDESVSDAIIQSTLDTSIDNLDYMGYITKLLWTVGIFEVTPKVLKLVSKPFKTNTFMDTAMIPEVIYHEFSHVALSDFVSLKRSNPLNEGMANYFAAVINGHSKIAAKNAGHSKNVSPYSGKKKIMYSARFETEKAAHSNFVFSFLWRLRERFESELPNGKELADKLIFTSRKHIRYADKAIKDDLIPSLVDAVEEVFPKAQSRKIRLLVNDEALKAGI